MHASTSASSFSAGDLCRIGIFTALIIVCSQLSIPMPAGVPMTLQTFIIPVAGIILGAKRGTAAVCVYILLGAVGLPVFAGFAGGFGVLFNMTGGFILSFPLLSLFSALGSRKENRLHTILGTTVGSALNFLCGSLMFAAVTGTGLAHAFTACVLPFIPVTIIKILLSSFIGLYLKKSLLRAGLLPREASAS